MTEASLAQQRHLDALARERKARGWLLYRREGGRIHRLQGDTWAVPASEGGFWLVDLTRELCPCEDHSYACTDRDTGRVLMPCKHIAAARYARAEVDNLDPAEEGYDLKCARVQAGLDQEQPHLCYDGWVYLTYLAPDEAGGDEVEHTYRVACRRCAQAAR